jgi:hypothetical protein
MDEKQITIDQLVQILESLAQVENLTIFKIKDTWRITSGVPGVDRDVEEFGCLLHLEHARTLRDIITKTITYCLDHEPIMGGPAF